MQYPRFDQPRRLPEGGFAVRVWRAADDHEDIRTETLLKAQQSLAALQRAHALLTPRKTKPLTRTVGAKPKLTPEVQRCIVERIGKGMSKKDAAQATGIGERTFYRWMRQGEDAADETDPYWLFWHQVEVARQSWQECLLEGVRDTGKHDWRAYMALLERSFRTQWGRVVKPGDLGDERITVQFIKPEIDPDAKGDDLVVVGDLDEHNESEGKNGNGSNGGAE